MLQACNNVVSLALALRAEEVQWCTWHAKETYSKTPSLTQTSSKQLWDDWNQWLKRRTTVNQAPEILQSLPHHLSPCSLPQIIAELSGSTASSRKQVVSAILKEPFDIQILTFIHLYLYSGHKTMDPKTKVMLWQQATVLHNSPLPLFTRIWLTRALYDNALVLSKPKEEKKVHHRRTSFSLKSLLNELMKRYPKVIPDFSRCLWETQVLTKQALADGLVTRPFEFDATSEMVWVELSKSCAQEPLVSMQSILIHMLHITNVILLLHEAASPTWLELKARHDNNKLILKQLQNDVVNQIFKKVIDVDDADVIMLAQVLHVHCLLTESQFRRAVSTFWSGLNCLIG